MDELYYKLREHFDSGPIPFPETDDKIEIDLLKEFFTEDDCRLLLALGWVRVTTEKIHKRVKKLGFPEGDLPLEDIQEKLQRLYLNGSINMKIKQGKQKYCLDPVVVGWFEHKIDFLTPEQVKMFQEYGEKAFARVWGGDGIDDGVPPQMRVLLHPEAIKRGKIISDDTKEIQIGEEFTREPEVALYDDVREMILESPEDGLYVLVNCICKQSQDLLGEPCKITDNRKHCLSIGQSAQKYLDRGQGTRITKKKAISHVEWQIQQGMVLKCGNYRDELREVCACCGCCCGVLVNAKKLDRPVDIFHVMYQASINHKACINCGLCMSRCQMDAIIENQGDGKVKYFVDENRCIGCGICVETCDQGAINLFKKNTKEPPRNKDEFVKKRIKHRFGRFGLIKFTLKAMFGLKI